MLTIHYEKEGPCWAATIWRWNRRTPLVTSVIIFMLSYQSDVNLLCNKRFNKSDTLQNKYDKVRSTKQGDIFCNIYTLGMAYRITDISEKPIYRLFCKYRISVSIKIISVKISDIGYRQKQNIGYRYRQMTKYWTSDIFRKDLPTLNWK